MLSTDSSCSSPPSSAPPPALASLKSDGEGQQAGNSGNELRFWVQRQSAGELERVNVADEVQRGTAGSLPSGMGDIRLCSIQVLDWLDEAHPRHGEQSALFKDLNVNFIQKDSYRKIQNNFDQVSRAPCSVARWTHKINHPTWSFLCVYIPHIPLCVQISSYNETAQTKLRLTSTAAF